MKSKYLFALAITAVFLTVSLVLTVSVVPVPAVPTVTVIIKDPSHTHGAVWLYQPSGARSHIYLTTTDPNPGCSPFPACYPDLQTQVDADTWSISVALTTDISGVPWSISEPITVAVYDLVGFPTSSHYNIYCCYYLQSDFTGTFVVCYDPNVSVGGRCLVTTTVIQSTSTVYSTLSTVSTVGLSTSTSFTTWTTTVGGTAKEAVSETDTVYAYLLMILKQMAANAPVGGFVISINKFAVLAPWLVVVGMIGCIVVVGVVVKKRRSR